jgi:hypothetical protein
MPSGELWELANSRVGVGSLNQSFFLPNKEQIDYDASKKIVNQTHCTSFSQTLF